MAENSEHPQYTTEEQPKKLTRRRFLGLLGAAAGAALLPKILERKETLADPPKITIIDTTPAIASEEVKRRVMGESFIPDLQLKAEFGENYKDHWDKVIEKYPQAIFMKFVEGYEKHGEKVTSVVSKIWNKDSIQNGEMILRPLDSVLDSTSLTSAENEKQGKTETGIEVNFDPQKIINLLRADQSKVVNGSFQIGKIGIFKKVSSFNEPIKAKPEDEKFSYMPMDDEGNNYPGAVRYEKIDGKQVFFDAQGNRVAPVTDEELEQKRRGEVREVRITETYIEGAYAKEKALENLQKAFMICNAYPDKLFIMAAGNEGEDLREARVRLAQTWPNNVLFIAQWTKTTFQGDKVEKPTHNVLGADIYVNNAEYGEDDQKKLIIPDGSSFSTPIIAAKAAELFAKGSTIDQVKKTLIAMTRITNREPNEDNIQMRVFTPQN